MKGMETRNGLHFCIMNYKFSHINATGMTIYYLEKIVPYGTIIWHRLDGPAIEYNKYGNENSNGEYYIMNSFIGFCPRDKELYEKAVDKYIKEQVFK